MRYCKRCVMPDTRPGITFDADGVCMPCRRVEARKDIDWNARYTELVDLCDKHRRTDGRPDCIIPVSGGKDSHFQTYMMRKMGMHPLLVSVSDSFGHTEVGQRNLRNLSKRFKCDLITYNLNHDTMQKMVRLAFEHFGSPTWPIDQAIYAVPLKLAHALNIPLVVYGENIAYEYGGPGAVETPSAKAQMGNDVVKPIDWSWWEEHGIAPEEYDFLRYPEQEVIDAVEPVYLSYFTPWDGKKNYELARTYGFRSSDGEWDRVGFAENFDQIDSLGYVMHIWMKWPKYGHARCTDLLSGWIRNGHITREDAVRVLQEQEGRIDPKALADFLAFTGYTEDEFYAIVERFYNPDIFACDPKTGWYHKYLITRRGSP